MANFLKSLFVKGIEIDTTGAVNGDVLKYNGTKFGAASAGGGSSVSALDDLSDVVVTTPEEFQGLSYNGTSWVNSHIPLVSYVRNAESTTITTGTCVYLFGATGDHASVKRADNNNDTTSSKTIGVAGADITASNNGPIVTRGYVDGIDLSTGYTAGDILWLGENGAFTKTKPTAPDHLVFIGVVVRATNNGIIYVATQNGYELDEIHNVSLPSPNAGEFLKYNGSLWVADAVDLGTDTVGNYVASLVAGTGISLSNNTGEGATPTITNSGVTSINTTLTGAVTGIVTTSDTGTVTSTMIADGTIVNGDVSASAGVALSKLASGTPGQVVVANSSGVPTYTTLTGDVTIDSSGATTIAANSVALGTDTTGNYMSGISGTSPVSVSHTPGEGSSATVSLSSAYGDTQNPYGSKTANYVLAAPNGSSGSPSFRALATADIPYPGSANQVIYKDGSNVATGSSGLTYDGTDFSVGGKIRSTASSGDEGGELFLAQPQTNNTLNGGVTIDLYQNRLRFFEQGGSARGFYLDITSGGTGVGTNLASGGGGATTLDGLNDVTVPSPSSGDFLKWNGTAWVNDAIDLGTDTTGNYMVGASAGTGISVSHTPSEGSTATISLANTSISLNGTSVSLTSSGSQTITAAADTLTGTTLNSTVVSSSLTSVGTLSSLTVTGDITVDTTTLKVDSTNNRVGVNTSSPATALDVIGTITARTSAAQDGVSLAGRSGGTGTYGVTITPTTLTANRTLTLPNESGTVIVNGDNDQLVLGSLIFS